MAEILDLVDIDELRKEVREKYREVAADPTAKVPLPYGPRPRAAAGLPCDAAGHTTRGCVRSLRRRRQSLLLGRAETGGEGG